MSDAPLDADAHRGLAAELFNRTWELLDRTDRTADDDAEMIHTAHASAYHWLQVGTPVNRARSHWQCSRVYAVVGRAEPSRWHAEQVLSICQANGIGDFDLAFAYEALARASAVAGDASEAARWASAAREAAGNIADADDRALVLSDLDSLPPS